MNDLFSKDWSYSEEYRHECELRYIIKLPLQNRRKYLVLVGERRGIEAQRKIEADLIEIWKEKKNGT